MIFNQTKRGRKGDKKIKVLIVCLLETHLSHFSGLALLADKNDSLDIECLILPSLLNGSEITNVIKYSHQIPLLSRWNLLSNVFRLKGYFKICLSQLQEIKPDLLLLPEENVSYSSQILVLAAARLRIPGLVLPYTISNASEPAAKLKNDRRLWVKGTLRKFLAKRYPHWVYIHESVRLFRLPWQQFLSLEWLGFSPNNPWNPTIHFANAVAVESEAMKVYYLVSGIPASQLEMCGALADDILANENNENAQKHLFRELQLPADKPMILCAVPPNQYKGPSREDHFKKLCDCWLGGLLEQHGHTVVVHPHPRLSSAQRRYLQREGVIFTELPLPRLIPHCHFYVASVSATIRWAIACSKPVLNYDVYRYYYSDYVSAKGVVTLDSQEDYRRTLSKMATNAVFLKKLTTAQENVASQWGCLDGKSGERLIALFKKLCGTHFSV